MPRRQVPGFRVRGLVLGASGDICRRRRASLQGTDLGAGEVRCPFQRPALADTSAERRV